MKTHNYFKSLVLAILLPAMAVTFSSCTDDDDFWYNGDDTFHDTRLNGYWQLVQANSETVTGADVNYLYFAGNGTGWYYFMRDGQRYQEQTYYNCQESNSGTSDWQINLQYGSDDPSTINYWFKNGTDTLWMQWRTGNSSGPVTYVYERIDRAPW